MALALVAVMCLSIPLLVECSFVGVHLDTSPVNYNETGDSTRFPDETSIAVEDYKYFISDINLQAVPGKLLIGAADTLYLLNLDLMQDTALDLSTSSSNIDTCTTSGRPDNPEFACHNHIRVYRRVPGEDILLVCGTHAGVEPRCQGVGISGDGLSTSVSGDGEVASDGIISYYPEFSQFGDFRNDTDSDSVYLSAGFFPGDSGAGRHFSISYNNITLTTPSDPDSLGTEGLFQTINANNNWLRFPVVFVGAEKADYSTSAFPTQLEGDYQFWFIFLREKLVTDDVIYSRLARVCRNDPGSTSTSNGAAYFTTFMKARIFCERSKPASFDFIHTLDYEYNSITSYVFSQKGRYYSNTSPPKRLLYGSFTGPGNGPVGSALCVYPADNSVETSSGAGRTKSVFDIFREDVVGDVESTPVENTFLECDPDGRPESEQQLLFINPDVSVEQIGDDPILMLENVTVTQMVQDSVCVVTRDTSSTCITQDVLFLGLDSGHVLKVVFATDASGDIEPVIVEDIELDDENAVTKMKKEEESGGRLYVSSMSKVYSLPLHRCSRFYSCSECVGARDPYCVWSDQELECVETPLSASDTDGQGTVDDSLFFQNIHTGSATGCNYPEVGFVDMNISVSEGAGSVGIDITASGATFIELYLESGTATEGGDYQGLSQVIEFTGESTMTLSVVLVDDSVVEGSEWFTAHLRGTTNNGVILTNDSLNITLLDDDSVDISFSAMSYAVSEGDSFLNVTVNKAGTTNFVATVTLQSSDGTALAGDDYLTQDLMLTFEPTSTSQDIIIPLVNDDVMEEDEGFSLSLALADGTQGVAIASPATASVTITDNDEVTVSLSPLSYTVDEEDGQVAVTLVKSGETELPVEVLLSTLPGTASAPGDYTGVSDRVLTFSAGQSSLTTTVDLTDDDRAEDTESFSLSLSSSSQGVEVGETEATVTVRDGDTVIVRLASTVYTWSEGDGEVGVVVEKIGSNERIISARLLANPMSALLGLDYSFDEDSLEVQFSSVETQKEVTLLIKDDSVLEESENFFLTLDVGPGATSDSNSFANVTITDDDEVRVQLTSEACSLTVTEDVGSLEISITRTGLSSIPVEVSVLILNGTAFESSDYSVAGGGEQELTIPASPSSTTSLMISILDDQVVERDTEFFSLYLSSSQTGVTTASDSTNISITDNDYVQVSFSESSVSVSEEVGGVSLTLLLSGLHSIPVTVSLSTIPLSASADEDFEPITESVTFEPGVSSRSFLVTIVNDDIREESEEFLVSLSGDDMVMEGSITETTVTIIDSDSVQVGFSMLSYSVTENVGSLEISITRTGLSSIPVEVSVLILNGTAFESSDYSVAGGGEQELTISASPSSTTSLVVSILDDQVVERDTEFFSLYLSSSQTGVTTASDSTNISITDNDYVQVSFSESSVSVLEEVGGVSLTLLLSGLHSIPVTVSLSTIPLSASEEQDFEPITESVTFEPGVSSRSVSVTIVNDDIREESEEFLVSLSGDDMVMEGSTPETTVTIIDSDNVQIGFSTPVYSVSERVGVISIVVEVIGQTDADLTANISTDSVTATANEDYQPLWTQVLFGQSTTSRELTLQVTDDSVRERTEEFRVQLTLNPLNSAGVQLGLSTTVVQIEDDDSVSVGWGASGYTVSESQRVLELILVISGSTSYNSTLLVSTLPGSATPSMDYVSLGGQELEISPTVSRLSVALVLLDDTEVESIEMLSLSVEPAEGEEQGVVVVQRETEVSIVSDDVVQVQFVNTTFTVVEGETAELSIFSTAAAPFSISLSASLDPDSSHQQSMDYLYLLQRTLTIPSGSTNTSLPLYTVPGTGNETVVEVVLELVNGTEPSVLLGPSARASVTIVTTDIICFVPTDSTPLSVSTGTSQTPAPTPSAPPEPPSQPEVGQVTRDNSECLYPSQAVAIAITAILALLVALLFIAAALFLLYMRYSHSRYIVKKSSEECHLPPVETSNKGKLNSNFETKEDVSLFSESQPATSTSSLVPESIHNDEGQKTSSTYL